MARREIIDGRVRLFENPLLERLSRVHPVVPIALWGPPSLGLVYLGYYFGLSWPVVLALSIVGLLGWTLAEYILHRWVFHWQPKHPGLRELFYPVHELHHDVQERDRLVMPPLLALPFWLAFVGLFWVLLGTPILFPVCGGFTIGYLIYDYIHFYTHYGRPRSRIGKALRRRHLQHHYAWPDRWYGVSSPFWDFVFRTHVRPGEKPAKAH